ncbi:MAG: LPS assembly protein LptD [Rhodobacteraceae bacterium]|nr:LPS assembly protein LptD [Paracoccaceae bacterium]
MPEGPLANMKSGDFIKKPKSGLGANTSFSLVLATTLVAGFLVLAASVSQAQEPLEAIESQGAEIVADLIIVDQRQYTFVADGNVVVTVNGEVLTCTRLEANNGSLTLYGPVRWSDEKGNVLIGEQAEVSRDFRSGVIDGVQMLIDRQVQISADQVSYTSKKVDVIRDVRVTPCQVCKPEEKPVWHFRSRLMVHDKENQRYYLRGATLLIGSIPVFYLPWLSIPTTSTTGNGDRSGFLFPELSYKGRTGAGIKVPYYQVLGPGTDAVLTLGTAVQGQKSVAYEVRNSSEHGWLAVAGETPIQDPNEDFATKKFVFKSGVKAGENSKLFLLHASEPGHAGEGLVQLFPEEHELSIATLGRRGERSLGTARYVRLDGSDIKAPSRDPMSNLADAYWQGYRPLTRGGEASLAMSVISYEDTDKNDVLQSSMKIEYANTKVFDPGIVADFGASIEANATKWSEMGQQQNQRNVSLQATGGLSYPLVRQLGNSKDTLEPYLRAYYTPSNDDRSSPDIPQPTASIDASSLASADRFAGLGQDEQGLKATAGVGYTLFDAEGNEFELAAGRLFHSDDVQEQLTQIGSGTPQSHYGAYAGVRTNNGLAVGQNVGLDVDLTPLIAESSLAYTRNAFGMRLAHGWINSEFGGRKANSVKLDTSYRIEENWVLSSGWQNDIYREGKRKLDIGLTFAHQCLTAGFMVEREFTSLENPSPATSVSFTTTIQGLNRVVRGSTDGCG